MFNDNNWIEKLEYLTDIFSNINELTLCLQGNNSSIFILYIEAFKRKLKLWYERIQQSNCDMFPSLSDFKSTENLAVKEIYKIIGEYSGQKSLKTLVKNNFSKVF